MLCKRLVTCPGCTLVPYNSPRFPATLNWISRSECMDGWSHKRMYVWLYQITNKYKRKLDLKRECHSRCDNNKCEFKKELDTSVFKMCVKKKLIYDGASLGDVEMCKRRRLFIKNTTVSGQKHEHVYFRL